MSKCTFHYFMDPFAELDQLFRSFAIRYLSYLKQKSIQPQVLEQLELGINRILNGSGEESRQVVLGKLMQLQMKGDYHQVIALTLLQDVAKWSKQYHQILAQQQNLARSTQLHQALILQSTTLINSQQQFHTIVPKQNDLLKQLLTTPFIITYHSLQPYRTFYRKLKDIKEFYPQTVKEHQKIVFLKTVEESVEVIRKSQQSKLLEWLFGNVFAELEILEPGNQFVTGRLKLMKKIVKALWYWSDQILYKAAFIVVKFSNSVLTNPHVFNSIFNLYQDLLPILTQRVSPCPLILYNHLVLNNLKKLLSQHIPQSKPLCHISLQILLHSLTNVFASEHLLQYFMLHYDCNFMEQPICQNSLNLLFEFVQNRANQKKYQYDVFKKYLKRATDGIRLYLNKRQHNTKKPQEKLVKFYEVKKKQYLQIVNDMNEKPKKLFKKLQSISNKEIKEEIMRKYSRIAKRSVHLDMKKMIELFAANNSTSEELFGEYVHLLFSNLSKDVSLEEFLRFFSSNFFLNGESQQILRVLDKITILFYNHQPLHNKILRTSDSTYTFANAIILLNSDLHNPQNQTKMQIESFYKICKRINDGHDLPSELLTQTYTSIKKNKINTFRNKAELINISANNFLLMCQKEDEWQPFFYDMEMKMLTKDNFYAGWMWELLAGIIDERQTMKLEQLIQRFVYSDDAYQCEVVQLVRKLAVKKQHIPLHAFEKILEHANFKHVKTSQKTISYLWLATTLIETFPSYLPTNVICQLLILTWRLRCQIRDDMYLREKAQIRRIKKLLREYQKRQTKKSIMDMFSSFLSAKDEEEEPQTIEEFNLLTQTSIRKMNHKILTEKVLDVLLKNTAKVNHRTKAIEFFVGYLRNDEQKLFEEFLSLLYLIFHLLYRYEAKSQSRVKMYEVEKDSDESPKQKEDNKRRSSSLSLSTQIKPPSTLSLSQQIKPLSAQVQKSQFDSLIEDLFYELLGLKQSSITRRIQSLKKKDLKKYQLLQSYSHFWVLKILLNRIQVGQEDSKQHKQPKEDNLLYLLNKSVEYVERTDRETFIDLVYEFEQKAKQVFERVYRMGQNTKESETMMEGNGAEVQGKVTGKIEEKQQAGSPNNELNVEQQQTLKGQGYGDKIQEREEITKVEVLMGDSQRQGLDDEHLIERFILNYRRVILELYVNCERVIGKPEMKKAKEWKWLIEMEKMIKDVMERNEDVNEAKAIAQQIKKSISQEQKSSKEAQTKGNNEKVDADDTAKVQQEETQKIQQDKTSKVYQRAKDKEKTHEQEKENITTQETNINNCTISPMLPQIKAQLQQQMDIECSNQQIVDSKGINESSKDIQNEAVIEDEELLQKIQKIERDLKESEMRQKKLQINSNQHGGQEAEEGNQRQKQQEKGVIENQTAPIQQQKQALQQGNSKQSLQQRVQPSLQPQPLNQPNSQTIPQLPNNSQPLDQQSTLSLIQQQQQQMRRLQQLYYSSNGQSSDLVGMPVYML